jgi:hypothetical protein
MIQRLDFSNFKSSYQDERFNSKAVLDCLKICRNLLEFLAHHIVEHVLDVGVLRELFMNLPQLQAVDFCSCYGSDFKDAFEAMARGPLPETLTIARLSLHECYTLSPWVFDTILSRFYRLTHLDVAGTSITDLALLAIPETAGLTHLNLSYCNELSPASIVKFLVQRPLLEASLQSLSIARAAGRPFTACDMESILARLPRVLRSLNIKGTQLHSMHMQQLQYHVGHLQELALGKGVSLEEIEQLVCQRHRHKLSYLDLSDIDIDFSKLDTLLAPETWPLRQIELCPNSYMFAYSTQLRDMGWVSGEFCSRKSIFRAGCIDEQLGGGGPRKIAVSNANVGLAYRTFMYG